MSRQPPAIPQPNRLWIIHASLDHDLVRSFVRLMSFGAGFEDDAILLAPIERALGSRYPPGTLLRGVVCVLLTARSRSTAGCWTLARRLSALDVPAFFLTDPSVHAHTVPRTWRNHVQPRPLGCVETLDWLVERVVAHTGQGAPRPRAWSLQRSIFLDSIGEGEDVRATATGS